MPGISTDPDPNGGLIVTVTDDNGNKRAISLDPGLDDDQLDLRSRPTGGMEFEFPDGQGGRLVLAFVPDLTVPELSVQAGRPDNLIELAVLTP